MAGLMADTLNSKTVVIEPEMLGIIAELDDFKGAWRALSTFVPERLSALRRVATIESIGSSTRIEGSKLSDQDVEKMLSNVEITSFETRDEQEVAGYTSVMATIFASWSVLPLTENHVRQLHRDLLRYSTKDERNRGDYKKLDNHVEAFDANGKHVSMVFQTASPFDTPRLMAELIAWATEALSNAQGRVCLRALQLTRKRHRAEQGHLLSGAAPNAEDHTLEKKSRTASRAVSAHLRTDEGTRTDQDRRCHPCDKRCARNGQRPPESADQERLSRAAWQGKGNVEFAAMTFELDS
jgi:hypothetical protein